jgi:RNA polymerase sigma-70 factor (ECF subfamily)
LIETAFTLDPVSELRNKRDAIWVDLETEFALYLQGDSQAVGPLFQQLKKSLFAYFKVRLNELADVEDLTQATLLKIHFSRDRYDPKRSLKTWVFTIASRTLIDHYRGNSSEEKHLGTRSNDFEDGELGEDELERIASGLIGPDYQTELSHDLNLALMTLKPIDRSVVYLYGVEGLSLAEIGQALHTTEAAAKVRAHRAYQSLRKLLVSFILIAWEFYGHN